MPARLLAPNVFQHFEKFKVPSVVLLLLTVFCVALTVILSATASDAMSGYCGEPLVLINHQFHFLSECTRLLMFWIPVEVFAILFGVHFLWKLNFVVRPMSVTHRLEIATMTTKKGVSLKRLCRLVLFMLTWATYNVHLGFLVTANSMTTSRIVDNTLNNILLLLAAITIYQCRDKGLPSPAWFRIFVWAYTAASFITLLTFILQVAFHVHDLATWDYCLYVGFCAMLALSIVTYLSIPRKKTQEPVVVTVGAPLHRVDGGGDSPSPTTSRASLTTFTSTSMLPGGAEGKRKQEEAEEHHRRSRMSCSLGCKQLLDGNNWEVDNDLLAKLEAHETRAAINAVEKAPRHGLASIVEFFILLFPRQASLILLGLLFACAEGLLELFSTFFIADVFSGETASSLHSTTKSILKYMALQFGSIACRAISVYIISPASSEMVTQLNCLFVNSIIRQPAAFFTQTGRSLTDINNVRQSSCDASVELMTSKSIGILKQILISMTSLILIFTISLEVAMSLTALIVILIVAFAVRHDYDRRFKSAHNTAKKGVDTHITYVLTHQGVVRQCAESAFEELRCNEKLLETQLTHDRYKKSGALMTLVCQGILFGIATFGLWFASNLVVQGKLSQFQVASFGFISYKGFYGFRDLASELPEMTQAVARLNEFLNMLWSKSDMPPDSGYPPLDSREEVEQLKGNFVVNNLHFQYPGSDKNALQAVSFRVHAGKRHAFVGPSGSGKSTLVDLLVRKFDATGGSIRLDRRALTDVSPNWVGRNVGIIFQQPSLFVDSIYINVAYGMLHSIVPATSLAYFNARYERMRKVIALCVGDVIINEDTHEMQSVPRASLSERLRHFCGELRLSSPQYHTIEEAPAQGDCTCMHDSNAECAATGLHRWQLEAFEEGDEEERKTRWHATRRVVSLKRFNTALAKAGVNFVNQRDMAADPSVKSPPQVDDEGGGTRLSGGQKQRIVIARTFLRDCDLIVLDEATSALDATTARAIDERIDDLCGSHSKKTVISITHKLHTVRNYDHVFEVSNGSVRELTRASIHERVVGDLRQLIGEDPNIQLVVHENEHVHGARLRVLEEGDASSDDHDDDATVPVPAVREASLRADSVFIQVPREHNV